MGPSTDPRPSGSARVSNRSVRPCAGLLATNQDGNGSKVK
ncbi:unnamed protein product [Staurois parvus]|uniref:Uncharacterized protein n=1 Tax=Staurois parvus TaxID=386267 RepID=A0ABN9FYJ2_9NEOB|nr:unnamed protein product [Staurois parvus]